MKKTNNPIPLHMDGIRINGDLKGKLGKAVDGSFFLSFDMPKTLLGSTTTFTFISPIIGSAKESLYINVVNSDVIRGIVILFKKV